LMALTFVLLALFLFNEWKKGKRVALSKGGR